jgi:hypothetical protein
VFFSIQIKTSGGASETEQNAETVMPYNFPLPSFVVTTVTPLAKRESAERNSSLLIDIYFSASYFRFWREKAAQLFETIKS